MKECTERGEAEDIVNEVSPVCLEIADAVLNKAEEEFGNIDRRILFPLADHIEFAVKRIKNNEQISNVFCSWFNILSNFLTEPDAFSQNQKFLTFFCIHCHNRIVV